MRKTDTPKSPVAHTQTRPVPLARIKDGGAQMRVETIRVETVNEYASDMLVGAAFPPVVVFDDGKDLWLADGYHQHLHAGRPRQRPGSG